MMIAIPSAGWMVALFARPIEPIEQEALWLQRHMLLARYHGYENAETRVESETEQGLSCQDIRKPGF